MGRLTQRRARGIGHNSRRRERTIAVAPPAATERTDFPLTPEQDRALEAVTEEGLEVRVRVVEDAWLLEGMQKMSNRISVGIVLAALYILLMYQRTMTGELTEGHGRALLLADDHDTRRRLARTAVVEGWSVRVLEARARDELLGPLGIGDVGAEPIHKQQEAAGHASSVSVSAPIVSSTGRFMRRAPLSPNARTTRLAATIQGPGIGSANPTPARPA